ncbi:YggT family protein [Leptolyngbya sp. 7M]|uniref:YggT family protein n=1 Tax=Leptolyngbya sp. 7M TaxID=2812896 RepID=UPI001B8B53B9|nr:YggT family protein [Leptolyngbya sp. 7M]QYO65373.1 YggT family protein [Leptolyngbya sp. 7M]
MLTSTVYPILWLIGWLVFLVFLTLLILRLVFNYSDPNPFGKIGRFGFRIRKMTERFVYPASRFLANFRVDLRLAPLVVIFIALVLTYFSLSFLGTAFFVIDGLSSAISAGNIKATIGFILYGLLALLILFIILRFVSQWFVFARNTFLAFVEKVTDPLLLPARRLIPTVGMFDLSAMVVLIVIFIIQAIVMRTLIIG